MKFIPAIVTVLTATVLPFGALAATYQYVGTDGMLKNVTASSAAQALASATDIALHSGVVLFTDPGTQTTTTTTGATTTTTASSSVPTTNTKAADLQATMHDLLTEHVASSIDVLRDIADNNKTAEAGALQEQDANAVALAGAIGSVYGSNAQATFLQEFRDHITASNAYTQALKDGSMTNQTQALANLDAQLVKLTNLLSGANPNIDNATLLAALRQHESLVNTSSQDYFSGDIAGAYTVERQALAQIGGGADYLAGAIVQQYPAKF